MGLCRRGEGAVQGGEASHRLRCGLSQDPRFLDGRLRGHVLFGPCQNALGGSSRAAQRRRSGRRPIRCPLPAAIRPSIGCATTTATTSGTSNAIPARSSLMSWRPGPAPALPARGRGGGPSSCGGRHPLHRLLGQHRGRRKVEKRDSLSPQGGPPQAQAGRRAGSIKKEPSGMPTAQGFRVGGQMSQSKKGLRPTLPTSGRTSAPRQWPQGCVRARTRRCQATLP